MLPAIQFLELFESFHFSVGMIISNILKGLGKILKNLIFYFR